LHPYCRTIAFKRLFVQAEIGHQLLQTAVLVFQTLGRCASPTSIPSRKTYKHRSIMADLADGSAQDAT
jgi:hypothetical protein